MDNIVTFEQWESGEVKLADEIFEPVFAEERVTQSPDGFVRISKPLLYYIGKETGTKVGDWFIEICEEA
jgi:hypothetical protein